MKTKQMKLDYSVTNAKLMVTDGKDSFDITDSLLNLFENVFIKEFGGVIIEGSKDCTHYQLRAEIVQAKL